MACTLQLYYAMISYNVPPRPTKMVRAPWQRVLFDDGETLIVLCEPAGEGGVWRRLGAHEQAPREECMCDVTVTVPLSRVNCVPEHI